MIGVRIARRVTNAEVLGVEIKQPLPESAELLRLCDVLGVLDPDEAGLEERSNLGEGVPPGQDVDDRPSGAHRASLPRALARCRQPAKRAGRSLCLKARPPPRGGQLSVVLSGV